MDDIKKISISLFIVFMIFPLYAVYAAKAALSDESQMCLGCHSDKNMTKQLENKEVLSLYANGAEFAGSVHNALGCAGCHTDISMENHPQVKKIKSKKEYAANSSKACTMCHTEDQLKKKPIHGYLITKVKGLACVECHGAHYIKSMADWKKSITEPQYCFTCHKYDFSMSLSSGESLPLSVNESTFKSSIHGSISCGACHMGFSKTEHPVKTYKNRKEYTANAAKACTMCHADEQLRKSPVHASLMATTSCVECHGSHTIKAIKAAKVGAPESQYCLSCHKGRLSMTMKNGESLSVFVDESVIRSSVHGNLQCTVCHSEFSKASHPVRVFNSKRDYSMEAANICKKCHADAFTKYEDSIHYTMFKRGNPKAPNCTDCHGVAHSIARTKTDKTLGLMSCNKCHGNMTSSYEASIHNKLRVQGNKNAPVCSSCHNAHNVQDTSTSTKIKEGCLRCHKDTGKIHAKWLYNPPISSASFAGAHFDVVSCAACHSIEAKRGMYLSLYSRKTGKPVTEEELLNILETDPVGLMKKIDVNADAIIEAREIWDLFSLLYKKGVTSIFMGKMDVGNAAEAHMIGGKAEATKDCVKCHQPGAEFFRNIFVVIQKADGKRTILNAKPDVLNSVYTILPVSKFYALGSSSIKLFDILFIIALIGGIVVPIGHVSLRIITSPLRSLRRMGKGGKK